MKSPAGAVRFAAALGLSHYNSLFFNDELAENGCFLYRVEGLFGEQKERNKAIKAL